MRKIHPLVQEILEFWGKFNIVLPADLGVKSFIPHHCKPILLTDFFLMYFILFSHLRRDMRSSQTLCKNLCHTCCKFQVSDDIHFNELYMCLAKRKITLLQQILPL